MKKLVIGILCCMWLGILSAEAQCAAKNEAIQPGERLTYELKFNWKFIWINAGEAKMDLTPVTYEGKSCTKRICWRSVTRLSTCFSRCVIR